MENQKWCKFCASWKTKDFFSKHPLGKDGLQTKCKQCYLDYEQEPSVKARRNERFQKRRRNSIKTRAVTMRSGAAKSARGKNLEVTITSEWIAEKLKNGVCEATGIPFVLNPEEHEHTIQTKNKRLMNPFSPSVERKDCSKGYTPDNCIITVLIYNYAKNGFSETAVEMFCRAYLNKLDNE
jgi:hypothetical protein